LKREEISISGPVKNITIKSVKFRIKNFTVKHKTEFDLPTGRGLSLSYESAAALIFTPIINL